MTPDICSELLPTPPTFDALVGGGGSRRNIAMAFGTEKLEWWVYPMAKYFEDTFIRFDTIHIYVTDRHTHSQTLHNGIGRAYA